MPKKLFSGIQNHIYLTKIKSALKDPRPTIMYPGQVITCMGQAIKCLEQAIKCLTIKCPGDQKSCDQMSGTDDKVSDDKVS